MSGKGQPKTAKYIFVTGGVTSSLGKGIVASSLAKLLQARGLSVTIQKFDPSLILTQAHLILMNMGNATLQMTEQRLTLTLVITNVSWVFQLLRQIILQREEFTIMS